MDHTGVGLIPGETVNWLTREKGDLLLQCAEVNRVVVRRIFEGQSTGGPRYELVDAIGTETRSCTLRTDQPCPAKP
jgi:hypothetical protein